VLTAGDYTAIAMLKSGACANPLSHPNQPAARLAQHTADLSSGIRVMLTIDLGHWFPNEDWNNCWHVSFSRVEGNRLSRTTEEEQREVLRTIFPAAMLPMQSLLCHEHVPRSAVDHWRLFFDPQTGEIVVPKGEMYTRRGSTDYFRRREKAKARREVREYQPEPEV